MSPKQTNRMSVEDKAAELAAEQAHAEPRSLAVLAIARGVLASVDASTSPAEVVRLVATLCGVPEAAVASGSRHVRAIAAREVAALAMASRLRMSWPEVVRWVGGGEFHAGPMGAAKRLAARLAAEGRPVRLTDVTNQRRAAA